MTRVTHTRFRESVRSVAVKHWHKAVHQVLATNARTSKRRMTLLTIQAELEISHLQRVRRLCTQRRDTVRALRNLIQVRLNVRILGPPPHAK